MYTLRRVVYENKVDEYTIQVDANLVDSINKKLRKFAVGAEDLPRIDEKRIAEIYSKEYRNKSYYNKDEKTSFRYGWANDYTFSSNVYDVIYEWLCIMMWEHFTSNIDSEIYDTKDVVTTA